VVSYYVSRNHALTFAQRTRENLLHIERAAKAGDDVHVVTQLAISLLGLVVFDTGSPARANQLGQRQASFCLSSLRIVPAPPC